MKYCVQCGQKMNDDMRFCPKCGIKVSEILLNKALSTNKLEIDSKNYTSSSTNREAKNERRSEKRTGMMVWSLICLILSLLFTLIAITSNASMLSLTVFMFVLGIMFYILSKYPISSKTIGKRIKKTNFIVSCIAIAFIFCMLFFIILYEGNTDVLNYAEQDIIQKTTQELSTSGLENTLPNPLSNIMSKTLETNFLSACEQIGMDISKVENMVQVDDWVAGARYSFTYEGIAFRIYCNMDSTINTVKLGVDTDIYKQGFEPYQVTDYIVDPNIVGSLEVLSKETVQAQLNYPATAKFTWLGWGYGRDHTLYGISNTVSAENAFGVEEELIFSFTYEVNGTDIKMIYFVLDGTVLVDKMDMVTVVERKEINDKVIDGENQEPDESIVESRLINGELGEYGKIVTLDSEDYINYYVPVGKYQVISNVNWCTLYVAKDEYFTNSDGFQENELVGTFRFAELGQTQQIEIHSGEHIELTISADVTLKPIS